MMIKGGIRIGGLSRISGFDADAAAYFDRAGVTDATAKSQINAFVIGMKALSLYNNMVSWPLRSAQNKGSGTTAYSLGGLGIYNGTLIGSATWGVDGVTGVSASSGITTLLGLTTGNSSRSILAAWKNLSASAFIPVGTSPPNAQRFCLRSDAPTSASADLFDGTTNALFGNVAVPGGINFSAVSYNSSNSAAIFKVNSNTVTTATIPKNFASSNLVIGGYNAVEYGLGLFSMAIAFDLVALSEAQIDSIRNLYKTTLGTGLGLP